LRRLAAPVEEAPRTAVRTWVSHNRKFSQVSFSAVPWLGWEPAIGAEEEDEIMFFVDAIYRKSGSDTM
jgi:hypothetical protein